MTSLRNRNYNKTEKSIINALIEISKDKASVSDISVTELCEVANISRSTFYLHYNDIESIFENVGNTFLVRFNNMVDKLTNVDIQDFSKYIREVFTFIDGSTELIKVGFKLGGSFSYYVNQIKQKLESSVSMSPLFFNSKIKKDQILIEIKIVSSGIIDLFIELLKSETSYDADYYIKSINSFLNRWIISLKKQ